MDNKEFLGAVLDLIRLNYPAHQPGGIRVAYLGNLIHRAFPNVHWTSFGFLKLKNVLDELETQGAVRTGRDHNGTFVVWPANAPVSATPAIPESKPALSARPYLPMLRREVWFAFVSETPVGRRFLDRNTGDVRMAASNVPSDSGDWVEIQPIDQETQRQWARDFLTAQGLLNGEVQTCLADRQWYRRLAEFLEQRRPEALASWNRLRTQNAIGHVRNWCESHAVRFDSVTESFLRRKQFDESASGPRTKDLRQALLKAIEKMATSELLELPIPAKHLVQALRPDLTSGFTRDGGTA
jgi:hypothetical protein